MKKRIKFFLDKFGFALTIKSELLWHSACKNFVLRSAWMNSSSSTMRIYSHSSRLIGILHYVDVWPKVGFASTMQEKSVFLAIVFGLHYLCLLL